MVMPRIHSFPPIENADARILILGSMPGKESLRAGQYYAHPRNAFWPIMGSLVGAGPDIPYPERIQILHSAHIAVWDVLASCIRHSSMDADIEAAACDANDFKSFFLAHRQITHVFFNGALAEKFYALHVRHQLLLQPLIYRRLPSTSPAHAALSLAQKLNAWEVILQSARVPSARTAIHS